MLLCFRDKGLWGTQAESESHIYKEKIKLISSDEDGETMPEMIPVTENVTQRILSKLLFPNKNNIQLFCSLKNMVPTKLFQKSY